MKQSRFIRVSRGFIVLAGLAVLLVSSCETMKPVMDVTTAMGVATGTITQGQAESIKRTTTAVGKTLQDITPEQEYYIGRTVAATVLHQYRPYDNEGANRYLNMVGQTLAQASDKPETFGGYHFLIVDSQEINAFAAPGGLILVTRGMLRCSKSEDALAAVLAHEIGHVQGQHGIKAIKKSRLTSALTILATESVKNLGSQELAQVTEAFEGSISDITSTLMNTGYSRELEREADQSAVKILRRVGYDPRALISMLTLMDQRLQRGGPGFAKTHPDPRDRIRDIESMVKGLPAPVAAPPARQVRFERSIGAV